MQPTAAEAIPWLRENTLFAALGETALADLADQLVERPVQANRRLVLEDSPAEELIILKEGRLESYRTTPSGPAAATSLLPGSVVHLVELLMERPVQRTLITLAECRIWTVAAARFRALAERHPEIARALPEALAAEVAQLAAQLNYEQERSAALRPYLITRARRGIVGKSRYAVALRRQIRAAAADRTPVLLFGEPGLEKDNAAALIHFGSPTRREPIIQVNCATVQPGGADLFGRAGGRPGLIEWLGEGTLVLNNIQDLSAELFAALERMLATGTYQPVARIEATLPAARPLRARVVLISEKAFSGLEKLVGHVIKVPPLRVRKGDIAVQVDYYLNLLVRSEGLPFKPRVSPEALRRLQSYDFPGNLAELATLVSRAVAQAAGARELGEEVFWPAQGRKKRFRANLLNGSPWLRNFLRSPWWPDRINFGFTAGFFVFIVAVLFVGPQRREENFALNMFWAWWWPLVLVSFPFVGRLWCAVCPFMIWGEIVQKVSLILFPRTLGRWPREQAERWGGWFLFALFVLIFLWEELWDLQNTAYLSAWLLLLITGGAVVCSLIFERRFWCRYLCPIGGMNGLFAKLAVTELRAQQGICSATCTTYQCYKGGPAKDEGQATGGCPLYSHPAQLEDNRDCVLCMTCLKACPHRSVEFNLRPPGIELWTTHVPRGYEVALLLLLLGGVFLHRLPEVQSRLGWPWGIEAFGAHLALALIALAVPALVPLVAHGLFRLVARGQNSRPFVELAYGYLPLVLGGTLAHYLHLGLGEAGKIMPVTLATFGLTGVQLPVLVAHPAVITFLQGVLLVASVPLSIWLTQKIARLPVRQLLFQHLGVVALAGGLWVLVVGR
ncbi:MAG: sigma 54-interacting transcriptional regulator [Aphanocapsa lilacina HA4352-LM1]|jgi:transcriptional regulator with AAA-type ATPase domain/NAD-dependent dihydropyrimidine dehydrogenase PreA subunit|nr:sigma 54-interacting transcriptional regulator [Aphanocapsa lilacina HA4352-LM1]